MNRQRAWDIIASHGANPARWPVSERPALAALLADDAALGALRDRARRVDALLDDWLVLSGDAAGVDAAGDGESARRMADRITLHLPPQEMSAPRAWSRRWRAGIVAVGALAAALVALIMWQPQQAAPEPGESLASASDMTATPPPVLQRAAAHVDATDADAYVWTTLFTTTEEEERLI